MLGHRHIPIISYVQAGMMTEATDPFALGEGFELILTDLDVSDGSFGLRIKGESMLPEFKEGDVVIIDPAIQPLPGDFVVAKNTEEEATFKKYRPRGTSDRGEMVFELVPLNDDFPILQSERDHLRVIGVMVEHRKYRRR
ncbi:S24 family peptidase [Burkholderia multivorans]|nr:S24 family peptidase [Burkholderia multivorans]